MRMFLMLFVHVSFFVHSFQAESLNDTKACLQDPTQPFCVDYHLDKTIIEESLIMICGPKGMMPDMSACTIWRICENSTNPNEQTSVYCEPFSLYKSICGKMRGAMHVCTDYEKLCLVNGTVVKDCKIPVIPLPSENQVEKDVTGICNTMFMVACEKCVAESGQPKPCNHLKVYSELCLAMPSMMQCGIWKQMCLSIPLWSLCDSSASNVPRMEMFFHIGIYDYILFKEWVPQSLGAYFASLFVVFIMAVLGEGWRIFKHQLEVKWNEKARYYVLINDTESHYPQCTPFITRIARGLLRTIDVFIHYSLMLIAMTFNVGLFLAVILGAGVGSILFSLKPQVDVMSTKLDVEDKDSIADCH